MLFLLVPLLPGKFWTHVSTEVLILGLFAMSFNLLYGYMGQISFGHAAFFGVGAYATAMLFVALKSPGGDIGIMQFLLSLLVGPPVAAAAALIVGFFCVRLTGIYFAMLSLAFGELLFYIVFSWYSFTRGDDGIQGLLPPLLLLVPLLRLLLLVPHHLLHERHSQWPLSPMPPQPLRAPAVLR